MKDINSSHNLYITNPDTRVKFLNVNLQAIHFSYQTMAWRYQDLLKFNIIASKIVKYPFYYKPYWLTAWFSYKRISCSSPAIQLSVHIYYTINTINWMSGIGICITMQLPRMQLPYPVCNLSIKYSLHCTLLECLLPSNFHIIIFVYIWCSQPRHFKTVTFDILLWYLNAFIWWFHAEMCTVLLTIYKWSIYMQREKYLKKHKHTMYVLYYWGTIGVKLCMCGSTNIRNCL